MLALYCVNFECMGKAIGTTCYHILKLNAHKTNQFVSSGFRRKGTFSGPGTLSVPAPVIGFTSPA